MTKSQIKNKILDFYRSKDLLWFSVWLAGLIIVGIWNYLFLNLPAFQMVIDGFFNSIVIALITIGFSLFMGWISGVSLFFLEKNTQSWKYVSFNFVINIIRSIPQIIGILLLYLLLTSILKNEIIVSHSITIIAMAFVISLFIFPEVMDLIIERIRYFKQRDFYNAMLVCGIPEYQIINREILFKNSLDHLLNKSISVFGSTIFLQCSVDFILSVGLSTKISAVNFPVTLGSLLAKIDSKQDILAIGHSILNPDYLPNLFFIHLQGLTVAFLIVFTLLSVFRISNGFAERHEI